MILLIYELLNRIFLDWKAPYDQRVNRTSQADRSFIYAVSVFNKESFPLRSKLYIGRRKLKLAKLNRGGDGDTPQSSDTPAPGMRKLGDQAVSMATMKMKKTAHLGAVAFSVGDRFKKRRVL
jgi:hypothetical protein